MVRFVTFNDALRETVAQKRHLLLGNGFSIALFPDRFRYGSLLDQADFSHLPLARQAFDRLGTTDFEQVIFALRQIATIGPIYGIEHHSVELINKNADRLKELLVQAIAGSHPSRPSDVSDDQYSACRTFLSHFIGDHRGKTLLGKVYTLNYDLLLYWTVLHTDLDPMTIWLASAATEEPEALVNDDGFRAPEDDPLAAYVTWEAEGAADHQTLHFLHGALHLFDHGAELQKKCWERAGQIPLIDQIRAELALDKFPLFVAEGNSQGKLARIRHSGYLQRSLKSFASMCRSSTKTGTALFIYGHSLAANDDHVLRFIERGKIENLYVSLFGDPASDFNKRIVARANRMALLRDRYPLEVSFYDAVDAAPWGRAD